MPDYRSEPLASDHHVTDFDCGEQILNLWLTQHALDSNLRGTARTFVWTEPTGRVVAYYALAAHRVRRDDVPSRVGRGGPTEIPAVLIARLALDLNLRGAGLGPVLVADALARIVQATRMVGARLIVVDALHENVANFYEHLGFGRVPGSLVLVMKVADAEAAVRNSTRA